MTTPDSKEAPERVTLIMGSIGPRIWWMTPPDVTSVPGERIEYLRADLVNREPSEGDVERAVIAMRLACTTTMPSIWTQAEIAKMKADPVHPQERKSALAAINAWRNP